MNTTNEILEVIKSIPLRVKDQGDGHWTSAVKEAFIELGQKHDWSVCASGGLPNTEPEWLFDVTWYSRSNIDEFEVGLALESEWRLGYYELRFDFEKLLVAKAKYKIMIFAAFGEEIESSLLKLKSAIRNCRHSSKGESYVLACWDQNSQCFHLQTEEIA